MSPYEPLDPKRREHFIEAMERAHTDSLVQRYWELCRASREMTLFESEEATLLCAELIARKVPGFGEGL
jgi:hypothetical protein